MSKRRPPPPTSKTNMPESPTARKKLTNHRTHLFCLSLHLIELALSLTLISLSHRQFTTWYRTTHAPNPTNDLTIHTALFITTCAPLCVSLATCVAAAYYSRKKRTHGTYAANMRRRGRGYWIDPSDGVDGERQREASMWNDMGNEGMETRSSDDMSRSAMARLGVGRHRVLTTTKRVSFRGIGMHGLRR